MTTTTQPVHPLALDPRRHTRRWISVVAAQGLANATWALANLVGVDLSVGTGASTRVVGATAVTLTSLAVGLLAWLTATILDRFGSRGHRVFVVLAVGIYLLSLLGPLGAATTGGTVTLLTVHTLVALALLVGMTEARPRP